ncbi:Serine/threonine-protein kinase/endoribonuclease IRE1a [Platanthera guangdongensis]|uniref:Serine/threonine-protein kinase/endoribonuclease IRE1a n=1 Tax=Platanthera guangdongensis TaxID=2320717 RepID=A0ABR2LZM5_9ASPA
MFLSITRFYLCFRNGEPGRFLLASLDGTILSVDCKSGIQWSLQTGSALSYSEQAISDNSGCFLYPGEDWNLYEYCADGGVRKLKQTIEEYVHNTPEIRGPEITIGSKIATIYLLDADSGKELHKERQPSNHPASAHNFGKKLVSPKLEMGKKARNYIIIVRTDYYLNSSFLGTPNWSMMESRITASYVNHEVPIKAGDDLNFLSPYQKDIPVYFLRKVNNAIMADSRVPMLPSSPDFHNNFVADAQNGMPQMLYEATDGDQNQQGPAELHFYASGESFKGANECSSGDCVMFKPFESKVLYEVASLQPRSNRLGNGPFENVLTTSDDSVMLADSSEHDKNLGSQWNLKIMLLEGWGLQFCMALSLIAVLIVYFWKANEPRTFDKNLNNRGKISVGPKKKKSRKPLNMNNSAVRNSDDKMVAEKQNTETNGNSSIQNSDTNLMNLLRSNVGEGKWVGKSLSDLIQLSSDCPSSTDSDDYLTSGSIKEYKIILPKIKGITADIQLWRSNGLPSPQLLKLMRDVVSGVAHLHELGIIHRDLKPQNVLVSNGKILTAKVSDMGISKRLVDDMSSLSHHATGHGSSGWHAPEQLNHGRQSRSVDLFSLGCILFFCMTKGEHPFGKYYERDVNIMNNRVDLFLVDHIPEAVDLLMKLLNSEPKLRPNAVQVLHHPLFWSSDMRLTFLRDISDRIELEDRKNESELLKALENVGPTAFGGKWGDKLDVVFINDMGRFRKYKFDCTRDLLRLCLNALNVFVSTPLSQRALIELALRGFDQYFSVRFPRLLIEVYKVICIHCREEDSFRKYFTAGLMC